MNIGIIIGAILAIPMCFFFPAFFTFCSKISKKYWDERDKLGY